MLMATEPTLLRRSIVISGGASGIGLAVARAALRNGAKVVVGDRQPVEFRDPNLGSEIVDFCRSEDVRRFYEVVERRVGVPDVVVAAAGVGVHERLDEGDPEKWSQVLESNVTGALRLVRTFVPGMAERGSGDVVFISSVASTRPYEYGGAYAASKAALAMAAETLRIEMAGRIRVTVVSPGMVRTGFFANHLGGPRPDEFRGEETLEPEDVADAVLYALNRPPRVAINELVIRPQGQRF
ncbi:SDR family NAD(P)-dependent oxidoreductase [bacterium]|nr:MAG: SDR family NAD(P)-dependent oxidoreductase [bacterium]